MQQKLMKYFKIAIFLLQYKPRSVKDFAMLIKLFLYFKVHSLVMVWLAWLSNYFLLTLLFQQHSFKDDFVVTDCQNVYFSFLFLDECHIILAHKEIIPLLIVSVVKLSVTNQF